MFRALTVVSVFALAGCSSTSVEAPKTPVSAPQFAATSEEVEEKELVLEGESGPLYRPENPRRAGDVFVYRFEKEGARPLLLTERVEAQDDETTTLVVTLEGAGKIETLRAVLSRRSERLLAVTKEDEARTALPKSAYEKLLAKTAFVPDENAGLVSSEKQTCLVGTAESACETKKFSVTVGEREASLTITRSESVGRDVLGEVIGTSGELIYRASLVEAKRGEAGAAERGAEASRTRTIRETLLAGEQL